MKRLIMVLFVVCALAVALHPLYAADPPPAPLAVCNKGRCVMSEADYDKYRDWHFSLLDAMKAIQEHDSELQAENETLHQKLLRAAFCEAHRD